MGKSESSKFKRKFTKKRESFSKRKKESKKKVKRHFPLERVNQAVSKTVEAEENETVPEPTPQPLELLLSTFSDVRNATENWNSSFTELSCNEEELSDSDMVEIEENKSYKSDNTLTEESTSTQNIVNETAETCETPLADEDETMEPEDITDTKGGCENDFDDLTDPFTLHFCYDLKTSVVETIASNPSKNKITSSCWPVLNNLQIEIPEIEENENVQECDIVNIENPKIYGKIGEEPKLIDQLNWNKLNVKMQIQNNIKKANANQLKDDNNEELTPLQKELFSIINNYQDLFYPERTLKNGEEIRFIYCLHVVNHILKTRSKILHHNEKLLKKSDGLVPDEYRDQGLVRPKVIILVPFKESCLRIVNMISSILIAVDKGNVINKIRFQEEFTGKELIVPKMNPKPEDYEQLFQGNIDDKFTIGISFTKKSLKLYSDFYSSDLIIASPLGLRMVVGAEGDRNRNFDFLASVEVLILDQAELFLMQNWDHLLLLFDHLHVQPKESHGTDFSRIRSWVLNGWSKFYRQTLIFSSLITPEMNAIFNRRCHNYSGKVRINNPIECGSISLVVVTMSHIFQKFKAESASDACNARFKFFIEKILPQYKEPGLNGILIYVPSYFDYIRIRNYMKREDYGFVQICEYSKDNRIARARDKFFHNDARFLLYTERFHFFRRIKLKGIRHIIFYQLPTFPHFYSELCNLIKRVPPELRDATLEAVDAYIHLSQVIHKSVALTPEINRRVRPCRTAFGRNSVAFGFRMPLALKGSTYDELTEQRNQLGDWNPSALTVYCKYDVYQLSAIVKTSRASRLLSSEKDVHMFTTG